MLKSHKPTPIAILGGTFDPPHLGHSRFVDYLLTQEGFSEVWIVPVYHHPYQKKSAAFVDRIAMCRLNFLQKRALVLDVEKALSGYTIDLITHLKRQFPENHFAFVAGEDLQPDVPNWKNSVELLKLIPFKFYPRSHEWFGEDSSTVIREAIAQGKSAKEYLMPVVEEYIIRKKLYCHSERSEESSISIKK